MIKERPNPDKIANELAAGSAFFRKAAPEPAAPVQLAPAPVPAAAAPMPEPAANPAPVRPGREARRQMIRHPFELYLDQLERLRERADEQRRAGGVGSMSRMVRDAIDRYLDDQTA